MYKTKNLILEKWLESVIFNFETTSIYFYWSWNWNAKFGRYDQHNIPWQISWVFRSGVLLQHIEPSGDNTSLTAPVNVGSYFPSCNGQGVVLQSLSGVAVAAVLLFSLRNIRNTYISEI